MLQRIQTVWMALALLCEVALFYVSRDFDVRGIREIFPFILGFAAAINFLSILSFKNRKRQAVLNNLGIAINALLIGLLAYWLLNLSGGMHFPEKGIEPLFPLMAAVFLFLANIFIRRDDRLVKSVDRLR